MTTLADELVPDELWALPLTAVVTAANVADVTILAAVVDEISPLRMPSGRRRVRPDKLHPDKGYNSKASRAWLPRRGDPAPDRAGGSSRRPG